MCCIDRLTFLELAVQSGAGPYQAIQVAEEFEAWVCGDDDEEIVGGEPIDIGAHRAQ